MKEKKSRKSQILSILLAFVMVFGLCDFSFLLQKTEAAVTGNQLKIGDYIRMGSYDGQPIVWRAVASDSNGLLMLSDKTFAVNKHCFDSIGRTAAGSHARASARVGNTVQGSSYWGDSNMREWLNSTATAGNVVYTDGNPPVNGACAAYSAYAQEAGFLSNFTEAERDAMKSVSQKTLLSYVDESLKNGGTTNTVNNYPVAITDAMTTLKVSTAYYQNFTDKMFLPSVEQIVAVYNNRATLGNTYYYTTNAGFILRDAPYSPDGIRDMNTAGQIDWQYTAQAYRCSQGIRPAFYLDGAAPFTTGNGTAASPYTIRSAGTTTINGQSGFANRLTDKPYKLNQESSTGSALTYVSSNSNIVMVNKDTGEVTVKGNGTATITVTAAASVNSTTYYPEATKKVYVNVGNVVIGDYIQMGTYNGTPILWRCIGSDENGLLMLSVKDVVRDRAYDAGVAAGGNTATGSHSRNTSSSENRANRGSSYWGDSNARDWLNSTAGAGNVVWSCGNPPKAGTFNDSRFQPYDQEAGFLNAQNFTSAETAAMKSVTQKALIPSVDISLKSGGTTNPSSAWPVDLSEAVSKLWYDTSYYQNFTDKMFLLSIRQAAYLEENKAILGEMADIDINWWLRDSAHNPFTTRMVDFNGQIDWERANRGYTETAGFRPGFYLNTSSSLASGTGTATNPYTVRPLTATGFTGEASFTKNYGDAAFNLEQASISGGKLTYSADSSGVVSVDTAGKVTVNKAGTGKITVNAAAVPLKYYGAASRTITVTVNKAAASITSDTLTNNGTEEVVYATNKQLDFPVKLNHTEASLRYTSSNSNVLAVDANTGKITVKGAGTAIITATANASDNYAAPAAFAVNYTVKTGDSEITVPEPITKNYGDEPFALGATVNNSEQMLTYTSSDTSVAEVAATGQVTVKNVGTTTITVSAPAVANFNAAESKTVTITVQGVVPAPPQLNAKNGQAGIVTLTWNKPDFNGGFSITSYTILRRVKGAKDFLPIISIAPGGDAAMQEAFENTTHIDATVLNGTTYEYVITANNSKGPSPQSAIAEATPYAPPGGALYFTAVGTGNTEIELSWERNPDEGGRPVTGYRFHVYSDPEMTQELEGYPKEVLTHVGTNPDHSTGDFEALMYKATVTGLEKGKTYYFGLDSRNNAGWNNEETDEEGNITTKPSLSQTEGRTWSPPTQVLSPLAVTRNKSTVGVRWDPPSSNGGTVITKYHILYRVKGTEEWTGSKEVTPEEARVTPETAELEGIIRKFRVIIEGLEQGVTYEFKINAINASDEAGGEASESVFTIPAQEPGVPTVEKIESRNRGILFTSVTADNCGNDITAYVVYAKEEGKKEYTRLSRILASNGVITNELATGLSNERTYDIQVTAENAYGESEPSEPRKVTIGLPTTPKNFRLTPKTGQMLDITFDASDGQGNPVIGYDVYIGGNQEGINCEDKDVVIHGQTYHYAYVEPGIKGTTYTYNGGGRLNGDKITAFVVARNKVGSSDPTEILESYVGAPSAPVLEEYATDENGITVKWSASNPNGNAIQRYDVHIVDAEGNDQAFPTGDPREREMTIDNSKYQLEAGGRYTIYVTCTNGAGTSIASNKEQFTFAAPEKPNNVEAETGDGTMTVSWSRPVNNGGYKIIGYKVYLNQDEDPTISVTWNEVEEGKYQLMVEDLRTHNGPVAVGELRTELDHFTVTIDDLANGYAYTASVTAVNEKGEGPTNVTKEPETPKTQASAPVDIVAEGTSATEAKITWKNPIRDGGTPVAGYYLEGYKVGQKNASGSYDSVERTKVWTSDLITMNMTATATGLEMGGAYEFTVAATTEAGVGEWGTSNTAYTYTRPDAPTITELESEVGSSEHLRLTVRWQAPEYDGGTPITGYDVYLSNTFKMNLTGMIPADATEYVIDDSRIRRGQTYSITVVAYNGTAARNDLAYGTASEARTITLGTVPPPRNVTLSPGDMLGDLRITWPMEQYADMQQYIDRYVIYYDGAVSTTTRTNEVVLPLCDPKVEHTIEVSVISTFGQEGNRSTPQTILLGASEQVKGVKAAAGFESAEISWNAVVDSGDTARTTAYYVYVDGVKHGEVQENTVTGALDTKYSIDGLTGGKEYKITVRAKNEYGESVPSEVVTVTPWTNPSRPRVETITPHTKGFEFTFTEANGNGALIREYEVYVDGEKKTAQFDGNKAIIEGVEDGVNHAFYIVAVNDKGLKSDDPEECGATPEFCSYVITGVPAAPKNVKAVAGLNYATITFDAVEADADNPVRGYRIVRTYQEKQENELVEKEVVLKTIESTDDSSYSVLLDGLTIGTKYELDVRAYNDVGESVKSTPVTVTPGAPMAPVISSIVPRGGRLVVTWDVPPRNAGSITRYAIYANGVEAATTPENTVTLIGLENGVSYVITVSAFNYVGEGAKSEPVIATPGGAPEAVTNVVSEVLYSAEDGHSIILRWNAPGDDGGIAIKEYIVSGQYGEITVDSANREAKITGLNKDTGYTFSIIAVNDAGEGPAYTTDVIQTLKTPGAPELLGLDSHNNAMMVSWLAPQELGGTTIDKYKVYAEDVVSGKEIVWEGLPIPNDNGEYTATLTAADDGLVTGNYYRIRVAAVNSVGEGESSAAIRMQLNDNLVATAPGAPRNLSTESADGSVMLTWNAPLSDGNSSITNYVVYAGFSEEDMGIIATLDGYTFSYADTNLRNGITRYYKVKAMNAADPNGGPFSETVTGKPEKISPPTAPTWPEFSNENDGVSAYEVNAPGSQMTIRWNASEGDANGGTISYKVYVDGNVMDTVTDTSYVMGDLKENTRYNIQIVAVNELGGETAGEYIRAYKNLNIRKGSEADGFTYDDYYRNGVYANIDSDYNGDEDYRPSYSKPTAPVNMDIDVNDGKAIVTWEAPANNGNKEILGYYVYVNSVQHEVNPSAAAMIADDADAQQISGQYAFDVEYGEPYVVSVSAYNEIGEGDKTDAQYLSLTTDPPQALSAEISASDKRHVELTWQNPNSGVTGYILWVDGASVELSADDVTEVDGTVTYTYEGVINHDYIFAVTAKYNDKRSIQSSAVSISTTEIPAEAPVITSIEERENSIIVNWTAPANVSAEEIDYYEIYINGEKYEALTPEGTAESAEISIADSSALIKLRAISKYGTAGADSQPYKYIKRAEEGEFGTDTPGAPTNVKYEFVRQDGILTVGENNVKITWTPAEIDSEHTVAADKFIIYSGSEVLGESSTNEFAFEAIAGAEYDISIEPVAGSTAGRRVYAPLAVPENEYPDPKVPVLSGTLTGKVNVRFTWATEPDVTYYLIVNGDEEGAQAVNSGDRYYFRPNITDYTFVLKAVKTYEDGNIVKSVRSNLLQYNTSEDTSDGTYLSNPAKILGTVANGNQVKIFWAFPEELTEQKELGEIDAFKIVVDDKELEGVSITPADTTMSYMLEFDNILDKKNVQIRAYKTVNGKPFIASTSEVWVATPNCNVLDDKDTFDGLTGENPPYDDNGDLTLDVSNKDTDGTGEVTNTGVSIQIPVEINVEDVTVEFIDQYGNQILNTTVTKTTDGKHIVEFKVDMSENDLMNLTFNMVFSKTGYTKYTLQGIPYSDLKQADIKDVTMYIGDITGDGRINAADLSRLKLNMGRSGAAISISQGDLTGDHRVNAADLSRLKINVGRSSVTKKWN